MSLTDLQFKTLISVETGLAGDLEFAGTLLPLWWDLESPTALQDPRLRYLRVRKRALDYAIAAAAGKVDVNQDVPGGGSVRISASQEGGRLLALRQENEKELLQLESRLAAARPPKTGQIARQAPIQRQDVVEGPFEAHDRSLRGDPWRQS